MHSIPPEPGRTELRPDDYVAVDGPLFERPDGPNVDPATRRTIVTEALAGVCLGPYDEQMLSFVLSLGDEVTRSLVSLFVRVRDAGSRGRTVRDHRAPSGRDWITVAEICSQLGISPREWQEWRQDGPTPLHLVFEGQMFVWRPHFEQWIDGLPGGSLEAAHADDQEGQHLAQLISLETLWFPSASPSSASELGRQQVASRRDAAQTTTQAADDE